MPGAVPCFINTQARPSGVSCSTHFHSHGNQSLFPKTEMIHGTRIFFHCAYVSIDRVYSRERETSEKQLPDVACASPIGTAWRSGCRPHQSGGTTPTPYLPSVKGDDDKKPLQFSPSFYPTRAAISNALLLLCFFLSLCQSLLFCSHLN